MAVSPTANERAGGDNLTGRGASPTGRVGGGVGAVINDDGKRFRVRLPDGENVTLPLQFPRRFSCLPFYLPKP